MPGPGSGDEARKILNAPQLCDVCGKRLAVTVSSDAQPLLLCAQCADDLGDEK